MERGKRIELSASAWKAEVLPLYEPRINTFNMTNCVDINLHLNPLIEGVDIKSYGTAFHIQLPISNLNPELIRLLNSLDLKILLVELFYTKPFTKTGIHIDVTGGDYTKLNFIFGGKDSVMIWYKSKDDIKKSTSKTLINTSYISYRQHEVDMIDKQTVKFPSIVQAGIPHNIINYSEPRWCLSIVLVRSTGERLTMKESIDLFGNYTL